jgi:AAA15 family ATPase/GTPase
MQTLTVSGFLGIEAAKIEINGLTTLIGAQASGKSIIARLFYFFNEYFAGFGEVSLMTNEHKKTYDSRKKAEFYKIFPQYTWARDDFTICFENNAHSVTISSSADSEAIDISSSKSVADYFRGLKAVFKDFYESFPEAERFAKTRMLREFRRLSTDSELERYDSPLFVPAARSFYATIREEIFSILSIDEKIDRIIMQFGDFYETVKLSMRISESSRANAPSTSSRTERQFFQSIVKGQYVRADNRDWIETNRGRIEISKASSGQQEAVPLLFAISRFPAPGRTLIIEEPEAHLFPESQVEILKFIVSQSINRSTNILFTTHSPYLLSALNNHILKGQRGMLDGIRGEQVRAYALERGKSRSIVDEQTNLVSADYIDSVSERVMEEFVSLLEGEDEA